MKTEIPSDHAAPDARVPRAAWTLGCRVPSSGAACPRALRPSLRMALIVTTRHIS